MQEIYLDYNATTPLDPRVLDAMLPYLNQHFGNPSSTTHSYGWIADEAVEMAREQVASLVGARPDCIVFTSGATEALNLILKGVASSNTSRGRHIVTTATEHRAVLDTCEALTRHGLEITYVGVNEDGLLDPDEFASAIREDTILTSVIWANNETGVILPVERVAEISRERGVPILSDATQAVGKIPVSAEHVDFLVGSAHKIYGPKGAGFAYIRRRRPPLRLTPLIDGGGQERGMRGGTLNTPAIVGFGKAAELATDEMTGERARLKPLRDRLESLLIERVGAVVNGSRENRLWQTTNLELPSISSASLIGKLKGVAISAGSACTSGSGKPSHVLRAYGLTDTEAGSSIRIALGRPTTESDVEKATRALLETAESLGADVSQQKMHLT